MPTDLPQVWILTEGEYDDAHVVGYVTEEAAAALEARGVSLRPVPHLPDLRVVDLPPVFSGGGFIFWTGHTSIGEGQVKERWELEGLPFSEVVGTHQHEANPVPECRCDVKWHESSYTMGVELWVFGTDIERCRETFAREKARILADPANITADIWMAERTKALATEPGKRIHGRYGPWLLPYEPNVGLRPYFQTRGVVLNEEGRDVEFQAAAERTKDGAW